MPNALKTPKPHQADNEHMVSPIGRGPEQTPVYSPSSAKGLTTPTERRPSGEFRKNERRGG